MTATLRQTLSGTKKLRNHYSDNFYDTEYVLPPVVIYSIRVRQRIMVNKYTVKLAASNENM